MHEQLRILSHGFHQKEKKCTNGVVFHDNLDRTIIISSMNTRDKTLFSAWGMAAAAGHPHALLGEAHHSRLWEHHSHQHHHSQHPLARHQHQGYHEALGHHQHPFQAENILSGESNRMLGFMFLVKIQ